MHQFFALFCFCLLACNNSPPPIDAGPHVPAVVEDHPSPGVLVTLTSTPPGAKVSDAIDNTYGVTPVAVALPRSDNPVKLRFTWSDGQSQLVEFSPNIDRSVDVSPEGCQGICGRCCLCNTCNCSCTHQP